MYEAKKPNISGVGANGFVLLTQHALSRTTHYRFLDFFDLYRHNKIGRKALPRHGII